MGKYFEYVKNLAEKSIVKAQYLTSKKVLFEKQSQFDNYGENEWDKEQFPALKLSTVRRKKGNDKPLIRTSKLQKALYMENMEDFTSLEVHEVSDKYGRIYNKFAEDYVPKKGGTHNFNKLSDSELDGAIDTFISYFIEGLKNG